MSDNTTIPNARGRGRAMAIVVAILLAGAMIAGAIYVSGRDTTRVVGTTSAQTAYEYAIAGWSYVGQKTDGTPDPLDLKTLATLAHIEILDGQDLGEPIRCTEPRG